MDKKLSRLRRAKKTRAKQKQLGVNRLVVNRTSRHIYAQVITPDSKVLVSASTVEKSMSSDNDYTGNVDAAKKIGQIVAERAIEKGVTSVSFDRSGFKFHGRVAALAESARQAGLQF